MSMATPTHHSPAPNTRTMITAAVVAGIPAGLVYALVTLSLANPVLFQAETIELGNAFLVDHGWGRTLWTVIGSMGMGIGLALLLVPVLRACGTPTPRRGLAVSGIAFVAMILVPGLFMTPMPPGVEHAAAVATRQAQWLLVGAGSCLLYLLGATALGRLRRTPLSKTVGVVVAAVGMASLIALYWRGGLDGHGGHGLPSTLVSGFQHMAILSNGALFLALALLVPAALKRLQA